MKPFSFTQTIKVGCYASGTEYSDHIHKKLQKISVVLCVVLGKNYTNAYKTSDFGLINYKYPQKPNKKKMEKNGQNIYKAKKKQ